MTLAVGNHVVKLGADGKPVEGEGHVEFEVLEVGNYSFDGDVQVQTAKLKVVK